MSRDEGFSDQTVPVGRRVFLGIAGLGILGVLFGSRVQRAVGSAVGTGLGGLIPGGDRFRIYSVTGSFPKVDPSAYRLKITGLVNRPHTLTLDQLMTMPSVKIVKDFQCVTGWKVPQVHWEGVRLSDILDVVGVSDRATAVEFDSYDGVDTESLTLSQARLPDVIVAYRMLGGPITTPHGGPVRLYVAPMYGYKSLKWLSEVRLVEKPTLGFWEANGYPVDAWINGSQNASVS